MGGESSAGPESLKHAGLVLLLLSDTHTGWRSSASWGYFSVSEDKTVLLGYTGNPSVIYTFKSETAGSWRVRLWAGRSLGHFLFCAFPSASQVHAWRLLLHCADAGELALCKWSSLKFHQDYLCKLNINIHYQSKVFTHIFLHFQCYLILSKKIWTLSILW